MKCFLKEKTFVEGSTKEYFSGYFFEEYNMYQEEEAIKYLKSGLCTNQLKEKLRVLSGSYYFIGSDDNGTLYIVTDPIRSRPLFYKYDEAGELIISDIESLPQCYTNHEVIDKAAVVQLKILGYTIGNKTLLQGFKQITAGSVLKIKNNKIIEDNYIEFRTPDMVDKNLLMKQLLGAYDKAFERMIRYLDGRQALVPLSGGLDSRFILQGLVKKGYKNILAYSYGKEIAGEAAVSKKIADTLNVKWKFIYYDPHEMKKIFYGKEYSAMARTAGNITSNPLLSGWYALYYLKKNHLIDKNAVNMVGHSAASIGEELTRKELLEHTMISKDRAIELYLMIAAMYTNSTVKYKDKLVTWLRPEMDGAPESMEGQEAYTWMKKLYYFGRHTNYLINSVKIEKSLGIDWYCPLIDAEPAAIWNMDVPRELADYRIFYREIIEEYWKEEGRKYHLPGSTSNAEIEKLPEKARWKVFVQTKLNRLYKIYLSAVKISNFDRNMQGYLKKTELLKAIAQGTTLMSPLWVERFIDFFKRDLTGRTENKGK